MLTKKIAEQLYPQLAGKKVNLIVSVGTGCSSAELYLGLQKLGVDVSLTGVQPFGSVSFGSEHIEDPQFLIAGIGSAIEFKNIDHSLYDRIHWIGFDYASIGTVELLRKYALFAGLSSGAAFLAATWEKEQNPDTLQLFVAPDTGHRYVDAVFSQYATHTLSSVSAPKLIDTPDQMLMPWSCINWKKFHQSISSQTTANN